MKVLAQLVTEALKNKPEYLGLESVLEKELLQLDILSVLKNEGLFERLTFIGGTSLRLCYDSNRLSEDLDFTAGVDFKPSSFSGLSARLKETLESKYSCPVGVSTPIDSDKDTSSWRVTISKDSDRKDLPSQKMHIDVCAYNSFEKVHKPVLDHYLLRPGMGGYLIPVQSLDEILADKMVAFAFRARRIKSRDLWDIAWLNQRRAKLSPSLVLKKLEARGKDVGEFESLINRHCDLVTSNQEVKSDFHQEMSRFLPSAIKKNTLDDPVFWDYLVNEIVSTSKTLLEEVGGPLPKRGKFEL